MKVRFSIDCGGDQYFVRKMEWNMPLPREGELVVFGPLDDFMELKVVAVIYWVDNNEPQINLDPTGLTNCSLQRMKNFFAGQ